jgi:parallel beta-helix repeat protein
VYRTGNAHSTRSLLFGLSLAALVLLGSGPASAVTFINSCPTDPLVLDQQGETYILTANLDCTVRITADNVKLYLNGRTITGNATGFGIIIQSCTGVVISGPGHVRNSQFGIYAEYSANIRIQAVRVSNCNTSGILGYSLTNSRILWNEVHNGGDGIDLFEGYGNQVGANRVHDHGFQGIYLHRSNDNRVAGNECFRNGDTGIFLFGADFNSVQGNRTYQNTSRGINLFDSARNRVFGNSALNNGDYGIEIEEGSTDNVLFGNTALGNGVADLADFNPEPPCENTWFANLFATKAGDGADCIF